MCVSACPRVRVSKSRAQVSVECVCVHEREWNVSVRVECMSASRKESGRVGNAEALSNWNYFAAT